MVVAIFNKANDNLKLLLNGLPKIGYQRLKVKVKVLILVVLSFLSVLSVEKTKVVITF